MDTIPVEVLELILRNVRSPSDLRALRAVNRPFCDLITPMAFRTLTLHYTSRSAEGLSNIQESPLANFVEEVCLFDSLVAEYVKGAILLSEIETCLAGMSQFPSLTKMKFLFPPEPTTTEFPDGDENYKISRARRKFQVLILRKTGKSRRPPALQTIIIDNFTAHKLGRTSECLSGFISGLSSLVIRSDELSTNEDIWENMADCLIPSIGQNLKSLFLVCGASFDSCPVLSFKNLTTLFLGGFVVLDERPNTGVWVRECTALEQLVLDTCVMRVSGDDEIFVEWSHLWMDIRRHLRKLVGIDVRWGGVRDISKFRYLIAGIATAATEESDQRAFSELLESMELRRGSGGDETRRDRISPDLPRACFVDLKYCRDLC